MITALVSILLVWQQQQQQRQRQGHHPDVLLVESFVLVPSYRCDRKLDLSRSAASRMSTRPRRRRIAGTTRWNSFSSLPTEKAEVESKSPEAVPAVQIIDRDIWSVDHNQQQQQLEEKMLMAHQQLEILNKDHNQGHHPDISISMSPSSKVSSSSGGSGAAAAALSITSVAASTSIALAALSETSWANDDNAKTFANRDESLAVINDINTLDGTVTNALSTTLDDNKTDDADVWRARLLLIGAAALYGTNFSLVKLLGDTMPVGISTTFRFGLAALATSPFLFSKTMSKSSDENTGTGVQAASDSNDDDIWKVLWLGFEVGLWNSIGYVAQAVGLETTLASKSAFICSMAVVVVPLLDYMAGKKLLPRQWVGAIMALVGVAFLELGGADDGGLMINGGGIGQLISAGDALSLVQPFVFGIGFWKMEKAMHEYPTEAPRLTAAQLLAVFFSSVMYALWTLTDGGDFGALSTAVATLPLKEWLTDPAILFSIFWTGCITTALTIYMETLALETLSAAETTLIFSTEPLWGTAFAAIVMGEQLQLNAGFGAAFILAACIYSNLGLDGLKGLTNGGGRKMNLPKFPPKIPSWLSSTLAGGLATWSVASKRLPTQEVNDVVDDLMETLVNKWP
eukprot:CAMPEP_0113521742 /NCGR_PEP_ID=MMETSP0014_2-20120614/44813_1 /TAXON_ID=2857 /ORGANISM="Nitzschia sp." /LENGTH=627 /DNA_ID=CAMNT_0000419743 /DNA_START=322 /DNA_END=2205 /DNA_ORIENTATION=+ /assembly_acc=CAM_ASM_000159